MYQFKTVTTKGIYVQVPDTKPAKKQLARELGCSYFELPSSGGIVEVRSEDERDLQTLRKTFDVLDFNYVG